MTVLVQMPTKAEKKDFILGKTISILKNQLDVFLIWVGFYFVSKEIISLKNKKFTLDLFFYYQVLDSSPWHTKDIIDKDNRLL